MLFSADTTRAERFKYVLVIEVLRNLSRSIARSHCPCQVNTTSAIVLSKQTCGSSSGRLLDSQDGCCAIVVLVQVVLISHLSSNSQVASLIEDAGLEVYSNLVRSEWSQSFVTDDSGQHLLASLDGYGVVRSSVLTLVLHDSGDGSSLTGLNAGRSLHVDREVILVEVYDADIVNNDIILILVDTCCRNRSKDTY